MASIPSSCRLMHQSTGSYLQNRGHCLVALLLQGLCPTRLLETFQSLPKSDTLAFVVVSLGPPDSGLRFILSLLALIFSPTPFPILFDRGVVRKVPAFPQVSIFFTQHSSDVYCRHRPFRCLSPGLPANLAWPPRMTSFLFLRSVSYSLIR